MALTDILTAAEALEALHTASSASVDTDDLAVLTSAVSERLDALCGPVVQREITEEVHDGGDYYVWLEHSPVVSVTTLYERQGSTQRTLTVENYEALTSTNFVLDSRMGRLWRRSGGYDTIFASGRRNIVVTYTAGRYANTAAVTPRFKEAAGITLRHLWQSSRAFGRDVDGNMVYAPGWAVPKQAMDLLHGQIRSPGF